MVGPVKPDIIISAQPGLAALVAEELAALAAIAPGVTPFAVSDAVGHGVEAAFPAAVALAAARLAAGDAKTALVTGVGHHRGEGVAVLSAV
jgi:3-oxoacyl-[acyl-carrier-protein] synthase II